jgi:CubicO group peptidase (beta-lactamase class C family)
MSTPRVVAAHHVAFDGAQAEQPGAVGIDERFPIASVTKTLTALLAARLAVDGIVSWDEPVGASGDVTLRALLTHTAGMPFELHPDHWDTTAPTVEELDAALADPPRLGIPPGTWHYSNLGYGAVARVLERTSGRAYPDLLAEHVLDPLGMTQTSYPSPEEGAPLLGACGAAGDLWSTIANLVTLARALNGDHPAVVTGSMLTLLLRSTVPASDGVDLSPGLRSQRVGLHRVLAATGTIRDRTTCVALWPRRGASVLVAEAGYSHDALVDSAVQRWQRNDEAARSWWWDGQEVIELRFGDQLELRLRETVWPFALFTGRAARGRYRGIDAAGSPLELAHCGDALVAPGMLLTADVGDSAFSAPALP